MASTVKRSAPRTAAKRPAPNSGKPVPHKKKAARKKDDDPDRIRFLYAKGSIDVPMLIITLVLLIIGITMMFSASHALSYRDNDGNSYEYAASQIFFAGLGLAAMFSVSFIDYRFYRKEFKLFNTGKTFTLAHLILAISLFLVALVIPFGVSNTENGPRRWLRLFGRTFQPSDVLKLGVIIFFAYYIWKNFKNMRYTFTGLIKPAILLGVIAVLMIAQPHLSGLLIMIIIAAAMLFIGGVNMKTVILVGGVAAALLVLAVMMSEFTYFADRIQYTFDPLADPRDKTYQSYQAVLAIGSGGFWGVGFGNSAQKYYYLPEAQNDFVFAVLCEEFGFVGGMLVIILFMIFVFRGFYIARKSHDRFGMLLATGISLQVGIQALLNIGVNVCCIPNTGISMPFFSYGGTALVIQLAEVGVMLAISRRSNLS